MKKTKALSILTAGLLVSAMAATVGAADYASDPGYTLPEIVEDLPPAGADGATPAPAEDSGASSSAAASKVVSTISDRAVTTAVNRGTTIKASYNKAAVKASAISTLAKKSGAALKVTTARYDISISSDSVTEAKDIDLAIKITKDSNKGALILRTAQSGSYGCTVDISVPAKVYEQAGVDLDNAAIYSIDPETKSVEKVADVVVDENGNITFSVTDGGTYVIL